MNPEKYRPLGRKKAWPGQYTSSGRFEGVGAQFALGFAHQLDPMRIVNHPAQDRIRQNRILETQMPIPNRILGNQQYGRPAVTIIQDIQRLLSF